jgi:TonB family protein
LTVAELDDGVYPAAFASYLEGHANLPHEELFFSPRIAARVADSAGNPVPFVGYRVTSAGMVLASGETRSDGGFFFTPAAKEGSCRVELTARGASRVETVGLSPGNALALTLDGARPPASPQECDTVFVIDTTISMAAQLPAIKAAIMRAVNELAGTVDTGSRRKPISLRLGLVLFRDLDSGYVTQLSPLGSDLASFGVALGKAEAKGGGDIPEALGAGLSTAIDGMEWGRGRSRLVFVFTDAPPKLGGESYAKACISAAAKGIRIHTVGLGAIPEEGEYALRQIAAFSGGCYLAGGSRKPAVGEGRGLVFGRLDEVLLRIISGELAMAAGGGAASSGDRALALLDSVQARMAAGLAYPESARLRSTGGKVRLRLRVNSAGDLADNKVVESSGSAILDRAALDLARSAFPTENPAGEEVELEIAVEYKLD